jgi:hypothetical protein
MLFISLGADGAHLSILLSRARFLAKYSSSTTILTGQNEKAMSIKCKTCLQTFMMTAKKPELEQHATNKHSKTYEQCFA